MPRKPNIKAVPVEQEQKEEGIMVAGDVPDKKTDAEQMTEIIQEVKEEPKEAVSDAIVVVKPKAKRASRAKPKEEPIKEEPEEEEPVKEEPKEEVEEEAKIDDKVACPDCGKQMSAKTLKYSHVANCVTKEQKQKQEETQPEIQREIAVDFIEQRALNRRAERVARRDAMVNRLMQHAF